MNVSALYYFVVTYSLKYRDSQNVNFIGMYILIYDYLYAAQAITIFIKIDNNVFFTKQQAQTHDLTRFIMK